MEYIFESVNGHDDYEQIGEKIFYQENREKISELYTEEKFKSLENSVKKKVAEEMNLNLKFILTFGTSITAFFPIVESFIVNSGISDINLDKSTVVYLGICALAIIFGRPKEEYRKLFSELRLRNVYGLLEDLTTFIKGLEKMFNFVTKQINEIVYDIFGMFNYTVLFVPFALTLAEILRVENITLTSMIMAIPDAVTNDGLMKLTTVAIGLTGVTLREVIENLLKKLPEFTFRKYKKYLSKSFSKISRKVRTFISKLKLKLNFKSIEKDLREKEVEVSGDIKNTNSDILKWGQWKDENDIDPDTKQINEEK